jgi:hypothetical protein
MREKVGRDALRDLLLSTIGCQPLLAASGW